MRHIILDMLELILIVTTVFSAVIILPLFLFRLLGLLLGAPL
jgi:hypothetical protein